MIKNRRGFTLFEVLIALGIFAGIATALIGSMTKSASIQRQDEELMTAITLAQNKMVALESEIEADRDRGKFPEEKKESGRFESPYEAYEFSYAIRKVEIPLGNELEKIGGPARGEIQKIFKELGQNLRELKLTISWSDEDKEKPLEFTITTHIVNYK